MRIIEKQKNMYMKKKLFLLLTMALLLLCNAAVFAQSITVKGTVKDSIGKAIEGASIQIKGSSIGTFSLPDGSFTIKAKVGDILAISAIDHIKQEINVTSANETYAVVLHRGDEKSLNDIVVTALGVKREAKELGYATATIKNSVLVKAKSVNVQQALNGKVSGLDITTTSSSVFEPAKINLRGIRSLTGNNSPMLLVDGAPTPLSYLSTIPPDDVQDVNILKSAAAAAIYGPAAVNGVIVITTKRGSSTPTITLSSTLQATRVSYFPKFQKEFGAGGGETADQFGNYTYVPYENQQYGPRFDGSMKVIGIPLEDGSQQSFPYSNQYYNDKVKFWNSGMTVQNAVSIAGQDFYFSIEDANIKGLVPDDNNRRTSFRFNSGKKYGNFSINYGINYIRQKYDIFNESDMANLFASSYNGGLFFLVMQTPSNIPLTQYKDWKNNKWAQYSNYWNEYAVNPYWAIGNLRQTATDNNILANIQADYAITPWLKATAQFSTALEFEDYQNTDAPIVTSDWAINVAKRNNNQYINKPGSEFSDQFNTSRYSLNYYLNGETALNKDWSIKYVLGGALNQDRNLGIGLGGDNLVVPYLYNASVRSGDANVPSGNNTLSSGVTVPYNGFTLSRLIGLYGTFGINYKGWANIEFTGRNDWDSRLPVQNRSFFYPSVNAAAVLTDAIPSLKSNTLSYLKLRAAYSKTGNVNINPYALYTTYSSGSGFPYGNVAGFTSSTQIPNPNLKPEFVQNTEAGIELGLLNNRINFQGTYYFQKNTDQVLAVTQSITSGYTSQLTNAADFNNYGVELDLGLNPLVNIGRGRIDLKLNASYNNNKITKTPSNLPVVLSGTGSFIQIASGSPTANNIGVVGGPAFQFQLSDYLRDPQGRVIIDPTNGYPSLAPNLVNMGRSLPEWILGASPSFSIDGFSVTMTWEYKGGYNFYSGMGSDEDFAGISARSAEYGRQKFVFPNSVYWNGSQYVPNTSIMVQDGNSGFWTSGPANTSIATNYFASADAWRLRELNISYDLPLKWFGSNNKLVKKFTVAFVGKNLFLFVPKSNQWGDPEFNYSSTGNTFGLASSFQSPPARLFGGSVTVQF